MALQPHTCPVCQRTVSPRAATCPGCGHPLRRGFLGRPGLERTVNVVLLVLLLLWAASYIF